MERNQHSGTASPADRGDAPSAAAIILRNVRKRFGAQSVLDDVSLEIARGEMLVVLGPSGGGKSTILKILAGLETPDAGEVWLDGKLANNLPPQARNLGVVFQDHALFQKMSVEENVAFGLRIRKVPAERIRAQVDSALALTRLSEHRSKMPSQLSGGQRQRVALARALVFEPAAMLFDEPYSALDASTRTSVRREVRKILRSLKMPSFFITHDQEEALEIGDRVAILNEGRIEQIGSPFEVYNEPKSEFVATFLGAANVLLGRFREGEISVGAMRLALAADAPPLADEQQIKIAFRPEDVELNFQPQMIDARHYLGKALVDEITYAGATERLRLRLMLRPLRTAQTTMPRGALVDESFAQGFPISVSRSKWDAADLPLEPGDAVVVGLKEYRVLPHFPMSV